MAGPYVSGGSPCAGGEFAASAAAVAPVVLSVLPGAFGSPGAP